MLPALVIWMSPRWVAVGVSMLEPSTTRFALLVRTRLVMVSTGLETAAVAEERRVLTPEARVTVPTVSPRVAEGSAPLELAARSVLMERPAVAGAVEGAVVLR